DRLAQRKFDKPYAQLGADERADVDGLFQTTSAAKNPMFSKSADAERQDKVAAIVKQMARNRVAAGEGNPRALIDWLHEHVGEMTGLSRQQLHEIVAGVRSGATPTRSELQQRLGAIRSQLRQELKNPDEQRNAMRQAALQRQIQDVERRIATGDFSKVKREP